MDCARCHHAKFGVVVWIVLSAHARRLLLILTSAFIACGEVTLPPKTAVEAESAFTGRLATACTEQPLASVGIGQTLGACRALREEYADKERDCSTRGQLGSTECNTVAERHRLVVVRLDELEAGVQRGAEYGKYHDPAFDPDAGHPELIDLNEVARTSIDAMRRSGDKCARQRWNWNHFNNDRRYPLEAVKARQELDACERAR